MIIGDKDNQISIWFNMGNVYRDNDRPAIIYANGTQIWLHNNIRGRKGDMPTIIKDDGTQIWCKNGLFHREGAPAVTRADLSEEWYENGILVIK